MQTSSSSAPQAPQAPQAPSAPNAPAAPVVAGATTGQGTILIPKTGQELRALRSRREEISNQLQSASGRRDELQRKLRGMDDAARPGVEQRIGLLDKRILSLENQLDETGQALAVASPSVLAAASTSQPFTERMDSDTITAVGVTFTLFVLAPIALAASRLLWKRASAAPRTQGLSSDASQRLDRIENAVDAIAIEVERVSEGQRFLTRLFTQGRESPAGALGVGDRPAEPIPVGESVAQGRSR